MANYKKVFMKYMDSKGIKYTETDTYVVRVSYSGDNMTKIPVYVFFDSDGDPIVQFKCWEIANFKDKLAEGLIVCNMLNAKYRWVKFYLDDDRDVVCTCDAVLDIDTCGPECLSLVNRVVNITDESYPDLMRALFN